MQEELATWLVLPGCSPFFNSRGPATPIHTHNARNRSRFSLGEKLRAPPKSPVFVEWEFPCSRSVVRRPDMEFSLFARARVQYSDFGQRHLDGGDVSWVKDLQRASCVIVSAGKVD